MKKNYTVRVATKKDVKSIELLEKEIFKGQDIYPEFFFAQAKEIFSKNFIVAVDENNNLIGYGIGVLEHDELNIGWILSMGVIPTWQNKGVGGAMLSALIINLQKLKAKSIKLTVHPDNSLAISLYEKHGFTPVSYDKDALGKNEPRVIMLTHLKEFEELAHNSNILLNEAGQSISFVNVIFGVSFATLALLGSDNASPALMYYLFFIVFSSFYASIFYANTVGIITRLNGKKNVPLMFNLGNAISEYLGVYLIVVVFPMLVFTKTNSEILTIFAYLIDIIGFIVYQFSGFDMLSRTVKSLFLHVTITSIIVIVTLLHVVINIKYDKEMFFSIISLDLLLAVFLTVILVLISVWHITKKEQKA